MQRFKIVMNEHFSDTRSNDVEFSVSIHNLSTNPIILKYLNAHVPKGAELVNLNNANLIDINIRYKKLCSEMTYIVNTHFIDNGSHRVAIHVDNYNKNLIRLKKYLKWMNVLIPKRINRYLQLTYKQYKNKVATNAFIIYNIEDANIAKDLFIKSKKTPYHHIYDAKYRQLKILEKQVDNVLSLNQSVTIEPDCTFSTIYILRFTRTMLEPVRYCFTVDAKLSTNVKSRDIITSVSKSVEISPTPIVITIIAIIASMLGVIVGFLNIENISYCYNNNWMCWCINNKEDLLRQIIRSIVLSLVIFNIYEHYEFGKNIRIKLGWRAALLIGAFIGFFNNRIISVIEAIMGKD